jgi:hypothetical protein
MTYSWSSGLDLRMRSDFIRHAPATPKGWFPKAPPLVGCRGKAPGHFLTRGPGDSQICIARAVVARQDTIDHTLAETLRASIRRGVPSCR